jgi:hypothetical protein
MAGDGRFIGEPQGTHSIDHCLLSTMITPFMELEEAIVLMSRTGAFIGGGFAFVYASNQMNNSSFQVEGDIDFFFTKSIGQRWSQRSINAILRVAEQFNIHQLVVSDKTSSDDDDEECEDPSETYVQCLEMFNARLNNGRSIQFIFKIHAQTVPNHYDAMLAVISEFDISVCQTAIFLKNHRLLCTMLYKTHIERGVMSTEKNNRATVIRLRKYAVRYGLMELKGRLVRVRGSH